MEIVASLVLLFGTAEVAFSYYYGSTYYGGMEYAYFDDSQDHTGWDEGRTACAMWKSGADLAMSKSEQINDAILESMKIKGYRTTWIGGTDRYGEGYFKWVDGTPITNSGFEDWQSGEPNNNDGDEDCVEIKSGLWNDNECHHGHGHVCQIAQNSDMPFDHSELVVYSGSGKATYWQAKAQCHKIGARLVKVDSGRDVKELRERMGKANMKYWVDMGHGKTRCSVLGGNEFEDQSCDEKLDFACETAPPHAVVVSDEHPFVSLSGYLEVDCSASGYPEPKVTWYKDGNTIAAQKTGKSFSTLLIKNAQPADAGRYVCVATNELNIAKGLAFVSVL